MVQCARKNPEVFFYSLSYYFIATSVIIVYNSKTLFRHIAWNRENDAKQSVLLTS